MINQKEIIKAICGRLKTEFKVNIYSDEVREKFGLPCFFIKFFGSSNMYTKNVVKRKLTVILTYFPKEVDRNEVHYLEVFDQLYRLFQQGIKLGKRFLHVNQIADERVGEDLDILQIKFNLEYLDEIIHEDNGEIIEGVETEIIKKLHGKDEMIYG